MVHNELSHILLLVWSFLQIGITENHRQKVYYRTLIGLVF